MKVLLIGDITGSPGRNMLKNHLKQIQKDESVDFTIANAENAAGGSGITAAIAEELFSYNIDVLTSGDHIWKKKEISEFIAREMRVLRPANYPDENPGSGCAVYETKNGKKIAVINLLGRVFMQPIDCPFKKVDECLDKVSKQTNIIFVDIHAEATSEKIALGWYLDGRVSCIYGTHTHVQTADERLLPKQSAYITDIGMTGPFDSVIGRKKEQILERFVTQMPAKFIMADADVRVNGAVVKINENTGRAESIKRIQYTE